MLLSVVNFWGRERTRKGERALQSGSRDATSPATATTRHETKAAAGAADAQPAWSIS